MFSGVEGVLGVDHILLREPFIESVCLLSIRGVKGSSCSSLVFCGSVKLTERLCLARVDRSVLIELVEAGSLEERVAGVVSFFLGMSS